MSQVVIENPILNSPYEEPRRHFRFSDEGITNEIVEARRVSSYFMPIPAAKKKGKQLQFDTEWMRDRVEEKDKEAKVATARSLWVPAVNSHGGFGRWAFLEIPDPWDAQNTIRTGIGGLGVQETCR